MTQKKQENAVQKTSVEKLKGVLKAPSVDEQFANVLKENKETFVASLIDLYNSDNTLQQCSPNDVAKEALKAAALKLPINKGLGFAYLVPYKKQGRTRPEFQIGYKGYIQLAMRTGQYKVINADKVYEGELKDKDKLTGFIDLSGEAKSDKVVGYFAHFELINGFAKTLYMTTEKVKEWAARYSKSYSSSSSAWKTNFDEMAMKTVLRNLLSHYGYLSIEMIGAMEKDEEADTQERDTDLQNSANTKEVNFEDVEYEEYEEVKSNKGSQAPQTDNTQSDNDKSQGNEDPF